jgi:hypothetical protein
LSPVLPRLFFFAVAGAISAGHAKTLKKKPTAAKLRNWRVSILRNRTEYLGTVEAANAEPPRP